MLIQNQEPDAMMDADWYLVDTNFLSKKTM